MFPHLNELLDFVLSPKLVIVRIGESWDLSTREDLQAVGRCSAAVGEYLLLISVQERAEPDDKQLYEGIIVFQKA